MGEADGQTDRDDETANLKKELEKERSAKAKALAEVAALQSGKRLIEKQSLIVENTLKAEEVKVKEFKTLSENLSEKLKKLEFVNRSSLTGMDTNTTISQVDKLKVIELEEALAAEVAKNEAHTKAIKKLKEKLEKAEKSAQREKESRLLWRRILNLQRSIL